MKENTLIEAITKLEEDYEIDAKVMFSKFLKKYGDNYTQEQFLEFLKKRYETMNKYDSPD